ATRRTCATDRMSCAASSGTLWRTAMVASTPCARWRSARRSPAGSTTRSVAQTGLDKGEDIMANSRDLNVVAEIKRRYGHVIDLDKSPMAIIEIIHNF